MKNCVGIADLLCAYADGELTEPHIKLVEDHLSICENCSAILKVYREISFSISETNVPAPDALRLGVMNRIQGESTPRATEDNKKRGSHRYILTRFAPVAACLIVGLLVWQFWGTMFGSNNEAVPAAAPNAMFAASDAPEPAAAPAPAPAAEPAPEAASAYDIDMEEDDAVHAPGRMGQLDEDQDFLEVLYENIDGFGPIDGEDARLFREVSAVVTITGDLPVALAQAEPEHDWQYGRFGWEALYVISIEMIASLLDEVGENEGTTVIYNHNPVPGDYPIDGAFIIILFTYGL